MSNEKKDKKTSINLLQFLMILLSMAVVFFVLASSTIPRRTNLFAILYPKPKSLAKEVLNVPSVDLKVTYNGKAYDGAVNISLSETPLTLSWETYGNPASCIGRVWGITSQDDSWKGPKDIKGGSFQTSPLDKNNPYVYTIDCKNDSGDGVGDSITINVGAPQGDLNPYITTLMVSTQERKFDSASPVRLPLGETIQIDWAGLNIKTPYSVCVATGSWPAGFRNIGSDNFSERFQLDESKIYSYTIYCSNESSYTQDSVTIIAE